MSTTAPSPTSWTKVFVDQMDAIRLTQRPDEPLGTLEWLVDHVAAAPAFFARAMDGGRGDTLLPRFRSALIQRLSDELAARGTCDTKIKASYIIGGSMAYLASTNKAADPGLVHKMATRIVG